MNLVQADCAASAISTRLSHTPVSNGPKLLLLHTTYSKPGMSHKGNGGAKTHLATYSSLQLLQTRSCRYFFVGHSFSVGLDDAGLKFGQKGAAFAFEQFGDSSQQVASPVQVFIAVTGLLGEKVCFQCKKQPGQRLVETTAVESQTAD